MRKAENAVLFAKRRSGSTGCVHSGLGINSMSRNNTKPAIPATMGIQILMLLHGWVTPPSVTAMRMLTTEPSSTTLPAMSILATLVLKGIEGMGRFMVGMSMSSASAPMGMLIQKIQRQSWSLKYPPSTALRRRKLQRRDRRFRQRSRALGAM